MPSYRLSPIHKRYNDDKLKTLKQKQRFVLLMTTFTTLRCTTEKRYTGRPFPVQCKRRKDFWNVVKVYSGQQFKKAFRLTCYQFRKPVEILRPILDRNREMAERASGPIQAEVKVALLLRILAGASYHDLCLLFEVHPSSVYDLFHRTLRAVLDSFSLPGIPTDVEELKKMSLRFQTSRGGGNPLKGCVGALDAIAIKIRKPHKDCHPALYYCRKHFYAIPVQAMVDGDYRFRFFSALCVGATHDSLSFSISALGQYLANGLLLFPFWIAADEAYVCLECLLTPFSNCTLGRCLLSKYKDAYNFFQSSLRMHVEQAFGQMVERFGILWRPLRYGLGTCTDIVLATMLLHNFCIDNSDRPSLERMSRQEKKLHKTAFRHWYREVREEYENHHWQVSSNAIAQEDRAKSKSKMRAEMVARLQQLKLARPYGQHRFDAEEENNH